MANFHWISGNQTIRFLLTHYPERVISLYVQANKANPSIEAILQLAKNHDIAIEKTRMNYLDRLSAHHQGIIAKCRLIPNLNEEAWLQKLKAKEKACVLILDRIQDPQNLGAILRTAAFMDIDGVVIPKHDSVGLTETVRKVSCGGADIIPFLTTNLMQAIEQLKELGFWFFGADERASVTLKDEKLPSKCVFIMGAEGEGIKDSIKKACDKLLSIPAKSQVNNLNVSVATALFVYEWHRQYSK